MRNMLALLFMLWSGLAIAAEPSQLAYEWVKLSPGVYAHYGRIEDFAASNHGDISNAGLVIGSKCAAVIDTGGSPLVGKAQFDAIKRLTDKPVCYVINTHVHPDHVMGNVAYASAQPARGDKVTFLGNAKLAAAMAARGRIYLSAMARELGDDATGAQMIPPTTAVSTEQTLELGDRQLMLKTWPTAHTDHDLTVLDSSSGTLWTGDLLFVSHAPVVDGSVKGWLAVLKQLQGLGAKLVVPGHGKADKTWPAAIMAQARYLSDMETQVRDAIRQGRSLPQTLADKGEISSALRGQWELLDNFHRRNMTAVYAELEWE